jgi:hypothetical protein
MRRSDAHEYRQAYNAQAVVCAEGRQLILATNLTASPSDAPSFAATILGMQQTIGLPQAVLADAGFASAAVAELKPARSSRWWRSRAPARSPTTPPPEPSRGGGASTGACHVK